MVQTGKLGNMKKLLFILAILTVSIGYAQTPIAPVTVTSSVVKPLGKVIRSSIRLDVYYNIVDTTTGAVLENYELPYYDTQVDSIFGHRAIVLHDLLIKRGYNVTQGYCDTLFAKYKQR